MPSEDDKDEKGQEQNQKSTADDSGGDKKEPEQKEQKEPTFTLDIGGEKRTLTQQEVLDLANKAGGADKKFADAAKLRKEAEGALRAKELFAKISEAGANADPADLREFCALHGIDDPSLLAEILGDSDEKPEEKKKKEKTKIKLEDLDPDVKTEIEASQKARYEKAVQDVKNQCTEAVDKDKELSTIIGRYEDKEQNEIKQDVADYVYGEIERSILRGGQFGAEMVSAAVQKARSHFKRFGIPAKTSKEPMPFGLGPSGTLPAEVTANEPIKRVAAGESGYSDNFLKRVLQRGYKAAKG